MLKTYFNYVQNVLGAKTILLPQLGVRAHQETTYNFAVTQLSPEGKELLAKIIQALKVKKYHVLELKITPHDPVANPDVSPGMTTSSSPQPPAPEENTANVLIIFGKAAAEFLIPHATIKIGENQRISGTQSFLTHAIEDMQNRPDLKKESWQHLAPIRK